MQHRNITGNVYVIIELRNDLQATEGIVKK